MYAPKPAGLQGCGDSWSPPTGQQGQSYAPSSLAALLSNPWLWGLGLLVLVAIASGDDGGRR